MEDVFPLAVIHRSTDAIEANHRTYPNQTTLSKAVADAGFRIRWCDSESSLAQVLVEGGDLAAPLADAIQTARTAVTTEGGVFAVLHGDPDALEWVREGDLTEKGWRPSGQPIPDSRVALMLRLLGRHHRLPSGSWQVCLDAQDEEAALADPRWGSKRSPLHPIYGFRRSRAPLWMGVAPYQSHHLANYQTGFGSILLWPRGVG